MTRDDIDARLRSIFSALFEAEEAAFDYSTSPDTLAKWDSLAQLNIIAAVEDEFEIVIPPASQIDMLTFELIGDVVQELTGD